MASHSAPEPTELDGLSRNLVPGMPSLCLPNIWFTGGTSRQPGICTGGGDLKSDPQAYTSKCLPTEPSCSLWKVLVRLIPPKCPSVLVRCSEVLFYLTCRWGNSASDRSNLHMVSGKSMTLNPKKAIIIMIMIIIITEISVLPQSTRKKMERSPLSGKQPRLLLVTQLKLWLMEHWRSPSKLDSPWTLVLEHASEHCSLVAVPN